eukprot:CAMPEP_0115847428 /NCGR_PEP_ID=MMETSP0287-20121206/10379_1 /TAXON_ID=412157 /ORGANISM="Chrysochromulina rotalis, Strain UIO044" /LENGTH=223 /DNA_ID=CAMNT_0003301265 /DNA_START=27 /DNA_END=697 /DNA_ORIENTATION=+
MKVYPFSYEIPPNPDFSRGSDFLTSTGLGSFLSPSRQCQRVAKVCTFCLPVLCTVVQTTTVQYLQPDLVHRRRAAAHCCTRRLGGGGGIASRVDKPLPGAGARSGAYTAHAHRATARLALGVAKWPRGSPEAREPASRGRKGPLGLPFGETGRASARPAFTGAGTRSGTGVSIPRYRTRKAAGHEAGTNLCSTALEAALPIAAATTKPLQSPRQLGPPRQAIW